MDKNFHQWRGKRSENWYLKKMTEQTKAAINKQDEDYEAANKDAPNEVLLEALRERAAELGCAPHPLEVPGNQLIRARFGTWTKALACAGLQKMKAGPGYHKVEETQRYKAEYARQQQIHREEKARIKEQKRLEAEANAAAKQKKKLEKQQMPPKKRDPATDRAPVTAAQDQNGQ